MITEWISDSRVAFSLCEQLLVAGYQFSVMRKNQLWVISYHGVN